MLAKITLVSNKHNRQGYLDGEDQKTLISFVLYGDPLTTIKELKSQRIVKTKSGDFNPPSEIKTICDRVAVPGTSEPISKDMIKNVKNVVEQYLPGMRNAQLSLSHTHAECSCQGHTCPTHQLGSKSKPTHDPEHQVVTLSKQIVHSHRVHETYARVTFDKQGKLVKLAVSR